MSEKPSRRRARRSDAEANTARIRDAALDLLARGDAPSIAQIAAAAGLSRQTVHGHFPNRATLFRALGDHLVAEAAARLDAEDLPMDPVAGLREWLTRAWQLIDRYPALLNPALFADPELSGDSLEEHEPVVGGLRQVLRAAADAGVLADDAATDWLVAAVIALGHAAGQEVAANRMSRTEGGAAFLDGALRLCLEPDTFIGLRQQPGMMPPPRS